MSPTHTFFVFDISRRGVGSAEVFCQMWWKIGKIKILFDQSRPRSIWCAVLFFNSWFLFLLASNDNKAIRSLVFASIVTEIRVLWSAVSSRTQIVYLKQKAGIPDNTRMNTKSIPRTQFDDDRQQPCRNISPETEPFNNMLILPEWSRSWKYHPQEPCSRTIWISGLWLVGNMFFISAITRFSYEGKFLSVYVEKVLLQMKPENIWKWQPNANTN